MMIRQGHANNDIKILIRRRSRDGFWLFEKHLNGCSFNSLMHDDGLVFNCYDKDGEAIIGYIFYAKHTRSLGDGARVSDCFRHMRCDDHSFHMIPHCAAASIQKIVRGRICRSLVRRARQDSMVRAVMSPNPADLRSVLRFYNAFTSPKLTDKQIALAKLGNPAEDIFKRVRIKRNNSSKYKVYMDRYFPVIVDDDDLITISNVEVYI